MQLENLNTGYEVNIPKLFLARGIFSKEFMWQTLTVDAGLGSSAKQFPGSSHE